MKKILIIFACFLFIFLFGLHKVEAAGGESWNFLPLGDNYLDPENHQVTNLGQDQFNFKTTNPFKITGTKVYSLFATYYPFEHIQSYIITIYDSNNTKLVNPIINETKDVSNKIISINFTVPANSHKISLEIVFKHNLGTPEDYGDEGIDLFFVFCEGLVYPEEPQTPIAYLGPRVDLEPVIEGEVGLYITNVNNPIFIGTIKDGLRAYDDSDGDVTNTIVIDCDNYSQNKYTPGLYEVIFKANDSSGNFTTFTVYVQVIDTDAPIFGGVLNLDAYTSTKINITNITNGIILSDNYYNLNELSLVLVTDNYSPNYNKVGTYEIKYKAADASGNESIGTVVVNVKDDIKPIFNGPMSHIKSNDLSVNLLEFINQYTATDETDGDITTRITVLEDNYTQNQYNKGFWDVKLQVTDNANNTEIITITIEVLDEIGPVFFIDRTKIVIDLSVNPLGINDLINYLQMSKIIKGDQVIVVLEDNYSENINNPGIYKIRLGYNDEELEIDVEILERLVEIKEEIKQSFFQKIKNFFSNIWKWFVWLFRYLFY